MKRSKNLRQVLAITLVVFLIFGFSTMILGAGDYDFEENALCNTESAIGNDLKYLSDSSEPSSSLCDLYAYLDNLELFNHNELLKYGDDEDSKESSEEDMEETLEPNINFSINNALIIEMLELHRDTDVNALLLRGVTAYDENGNNVNHLITIHCDGGFFAYVAENFSEITPGSDYDSSSGGGFIGGLVAGFNTIVDWLDIGGPSMPVIQSKGYAFEALVTYAVVHPESGEEFVSESRDVRVRFMGVVPMTLGCTCGHPCDWDDIQCFEALNLAFQDALITTIILANSFPMDDTINVTHQVTLQGNGVLTAPAGGRHFIVFSNFTLDGNVTLQGIAPLNGGGVEIRNGGTFNMSGGAISGNNRIPGLGGGVDILSGGTFNMSSGIISGNRAGTSAGVGNFGTFNMSGNAVISGNTAEAGGGVGNFGTFNMFGNAVISGNTVSSDSGGVYNGNTFTMSDNATIRNNSASFGGGVTNEGGTFIMSGNAEIIENNASSGGGVLNDNPGSTFTMFGNATISENTATMIGGGVMNSLGTFDMFDNATISENESGISGGGVASSGTFTMFGDAVIIENEADSNGGGVHISVGGTFDMSGDAVIIENEAGLEGGGVFMNHGSGTFTMSGDATISRNEGSSGGGVSILSSTFTMSGNATISYNEAALFGGGVSVRSVGEFVMSGGTVYKNTANNGGGVHNGANFTMSGGTIRDNEARFNGGGIFTQSYTHLITSNFAVFSGNKAIQSFDHGVNNTSGANVDGRGSIDKIDWNIVSIPGAHALNNYDINYGTFRVTYYGNGHTSGTVPIDNNSYPQGDRVTVRGQGTLERDGYAFLGWKLNGAGNILGATFIMPNQDVELVAQWQPIVVGGGGGGAPPSTPGAISPIVIAPVRFAADDEELEYAAEESEEREPQDSEPPPEQEETAELETVDSEEPLNLPDDIDIPLYDAEQSTTRWLLIALIAGSVGVLVCATIVVVKKKSKG